LPYQTTITMAKQKNKDLETLGIISAFIGNSSSYSIFGLGSSMLGQLTEQEKYPYERLGNGFELRPLEMENNRHKYSLLYKDGQLVSNHVFRKGGLCSGFKDGYCELIHYTPQKDKKKHPEGFDFGNHVLVNELGEIKMRSKGLDHPYHLGGNIARLKDTYYNLLTGEAIMPNSSETINTKNFLIIEHRYDFDCYSKEVKVPLGVYKIDKKTCAIEKIDDIK